MPTDSVQRTIAQPATLSGRGLFSGQNATVVFQPAPANQGIVFVRNDLDGAQVPAVIRNAVKRARRSALRVGEATIDTTEHVMSAVIGLGIDNLLIEIDGPELPGFDGSAQPYVQALTEAGLTDLKEARRLLVVHQPVIVQQDDSTIAALPNERPGLQIIYHLDYPNDPVIGRQVFEFNLGTDDFATTLAPARTFLLEAEAKLLHERGVGRHLTARDVLVIGPTGPLAGNSLRFADEPVRHKILDLLGDLALVGAPIQARIIASKTGHALNQALAKGLTKQLRVQQHQALATARPEMDVRKLLTILPHRYPMMLVDRVLELDGERRVLAIKNVTANEPFFMGHFPRAPIMPGVLIVEAMAQTAGILVGQRPENQGKLAVLLSLDRVKLRKPVVPGDQLIIEAEAVRIRSKIAHARCRAYVGQDIAAEAELKFMIVEGTEI